MPDRPPGVPPHASVVAVVTPRIAVPGTAEKLPSTVDDSRHRSVATQALEWQQLGASALIWELAATVQGAEEARAYSLAGQIAAVGEQLGLAYGAGVEVALWQEIRVSQPEPRPEYEMGLRAMAETQSYFTMGSGHGLANVALYSLAMQPPLLAALQVAFRRRTTPPPFPPISNDRADWIYMNRRDVLRLQQVAHGFGSREAEELIEVVVDFADSDAWKDLVERRGEDFHRWRPQSHGLVGVAKASPWRHDQGTRALGIGPMSNYTETQGLADEVAATADRAMLRLAEGMDDYLKRFVAASPHLRGPRFKTS